MAITPRTIFSNPASATVATVALLAFSAVGTLAYQVASHSNAKTSPMYATAGENTCESVRNVLGHDRTAWSERNWIQYAYCFEAQNDSTAVVQVARQGIRFYPASEALYNMAGYHQIKLGQYTQAIDTLKIGMHQVGSPSNGIMANNLAWASLWAPREMKLEHARALYKRSLRYDPTSCETIHTGLWVEYAVAKQSTGLQEYQALENFENLRRRYSACQERIEDGQWNTMVEVVGAAVLFQDVDRTLQVPHTRSIHKFNQQGTADLMRVSQALREHYRGSSINALCRQAMPLGSTHHLCVENVTESVNTLRKQELMSKHARKSRIKQHRDCDLRIIKSGR